MRDWGSIEKFSNNERIIMFNNLDGIIDEVQAESDSGLPELFQDCQRPEPIGFNRHDFTGATGAIRPLSSSTFTIDDVDGEWTMEDDGVDGLIAMSNSGQSYLGYWHSGKACFSEFGCQRENEDPRIAFAQMKYNI